MFSRQEHYTDEQIICWNCEEAVHQSAIVCPYCNVDVHRHNVQKASEQKKITPLPQQPSPSADQVRLSDSSDITGSGYTLSFLCSLFFLLSGSALFFLAIIIAFFARDGAFTISWPEHSWSAFFGLGLFFLSLGTLFIQKISGLTDES